MAWSLETHEAKVRKADEGVALFRRDAPDSLRHIKDEAEKILEMIRRKDLRPNYDMLEFHFDNIRTHLKIFKKTMKRHKKDLPRKGYDPHHG